MNMTHIQNCDKLIAMAISIKKIVNACMKAL